MLDEKELRELGDKIAESLEGEGKPFHVLTMHLRLLLSHLDSYRMAYEALKKHVDDLGLRIDMQDKALFGDKDDLEKKPGIVAKLQRIIDYQAGNRKLFWLVAAGVLSLMLKSGWDVLTHAKFP